MGCGTIVPTDKAMHTLTLHRIETTDRHIDESTNATVDWKYLAQQFGLDDVDFWPLYFQKNQPIWFTLVKGTTTFAMVHYIMKTQVSSIF